MRILIACEESQTVCKAFRERGHEAYSLDLQECSGNHPEWHIQAEFMHYITKHFQSYNFLGVHPSCQFLANSGVRWLASFEKEEGFTWSNTYGIYLNESRYELMYDAAMFLKSSLAFVRSVGMGYVEQPILHKYAKELIGEEPSQIINPTMFGHTTTKKTCLWLVNIPPLMATYIVPSNFQTNEIHNYPPGPDRAKLRSKTFPGIARAMAEQWG